MIRGLSRQYSQQPGESFPPNQVGIPSLNEGFERPGSHMPENPDEPKVSIKGAESEISSSASTCHHNTTSLEAESPEQSLDSGTAHLENPHLVPQECSFTNMKGPWPHESIQPDISTLSSVAADFSWSESFSDCPFDNQLSYGTYVDSFAAQIVNMHSGGLLDINGYEALF